MQRELDQVFIIRAPPELAIEGLGTEFWCSGNISAARTAWDLNDEGRKRYFLGRICKRGVLLWDIFILVTGKEGCKTGLLGCLLYHSGGSDEAKKDHRT